MDSDKSMTMKRSAQDYSIKVKKVTSTIPHEECWWGAHFTYLGLDCFVTEAHVCEQLVQGCYLTAARPGVELATSQVASQRLNHYTARPLFNASSILYLHHHLHFNHCCEAEPKLAGSSSTLFLFQVNLSELVLLRASSSTCSGWKPLGTSDIGLITRGRF